MANTSTDIGSPHPGPNHSPEQQSSGGFVAGISFHKLHVSGCHKLTNYQRTVGNFPLIVLKNAVALLGISQKTKVSILKECDGLLQSGELLLVLGRPGSGCTTFLKAIAGETYGLTVDDESKLNYRGVPSQCSSSLTRSDKGTRI